MQTQLPPELLATDRGQRADAILRSCVHCGFCNATCPTYDLLGDERDGPRGRIYLIKQALEAGAATKEIRTHLDRCLTCRACETTCPSGVRYGELLEIGRELVERTVPRAPPAQAARWLLTEVVGQPALFGPAVALGRALRGVLPDVLARKVPAAPEAGVANAGWPAPRHARKVLLLTGCAQEAATPWVNRLLAELLDAHGVSALAAAGCCGALAQHLGQEHAAQQRLTANLRDWAPHLNDVEAVLSSASGCGVHVKDYPRLNSQPALSAPASSLAAKTLDVVEYLERLSLTPVATPRRVAWQAPCTLQHGQRITGRVEALLQAVGHTLVRVRDSHLCCGSAGTYSVLQPELARRLGENKLARLCEEAPEVIATANVGCQLHLAGIAEARGAPPVRHWLELLR